MTTEIPALPEKYREFKALIDGSISDASSSEKYHWKAEAPFTGQGAAIALLVQSRLGGDIVTVDASSGTEWRTKSAYHYNLVDGQELHFCTEDLPDNPTLQKPRRTPDALGAMYNPVSCANALIERYNILAKDDLPKIEVYQAPRPKWMETEQANIASDWIPVNNGPQ